MERSLYHCDLNSTATDVNDRRPTNIQTQLPGKVKRKIQGFIAQQKQIAILERY